MFSQYERTKTLSTAEYLGVDHNFFKGKTCLDAGCGVLLPATINMLEAGADMVFALDLDISSNEVTLGFLEQWKGKYELNNGSVLSLPYQDEFFDFVLSDGVLHHTGNIAIGLIELCRVLKNGGAVYVSIMGEGGIMKEFQSILRKHYRTDPWFQKFIANLDPKTFMKILGQIGENGPREEIDGDYSSREAMLEELFDEDLCLTIKDRIQAPTYEAIAEGDVLQIFENQGISQVRRIVRPISIRNIRRYLTPYYYNYKHPLAEFLYGDGYLQYFGVKG